MAGMGENRAGKQKSDGENAACAKERRVRKAAGSRKEMSARQWFWGALMVFSLFAMFAAGAAGAKTVGNFTAARPASAAADLLLTGQRGVTLFAMEPENTGIPDEQEPSDGTRRAGEEEPENPGIPDDASRTDAEEPENPGMQDEPEPSGEPRPADIAEPEASDAPVAAFTFDDGPYTPVTSRIVDVFSEYNAGATFFVVGSRIDMYSDTLKKVYESGFEVASHTWSHKNLNGLSEEKITKEIEDTVEKLNAFVPVGNVLLRPPYGNANETVRSLAGTALINWSADSQDWKSRDADKIIKQVLDTLQDGDIILMHDLYECTAEAVEYLVPELTARGWRLVSVSELFRIKGIPLEEGILYRKPGDHY